MKYLFGNSESFPLQYDFLKTLESFMTAGTRVVQLEAESAAIENEVLQNAATRAKVLEGLEAFHATAVRVLQDAANKSGQPAINEYVAAVRDHGLHLVEDRKRAAQSSTERDATTINSKGHARGDEIRSAFEGFFRTARIPVLATEVALRVVDQSCELRAAITHPHGIATSFTLPTDKGWHGLRRVSDFATEVDAKVGVKKKWLRDEVSAENERLDEYFLGGFVLSDHKAIIRLRRKADQPDGLIFKLRREKGRVSNEVEHPGDPRADALPTELDHQDAATLERLWLALSDATHEALERRERMTSLTLDDADAIATRAGTEVISRLVTLFGPTVHEIAKRSPNDHELTLKCESDAGKREELYLRKAELVKKLQPLPASGRAVFELLGLSQWVPAVTAPPPRPQQPALTTAPPPVLPPIFRGIPEPSSTDVTVTGVTDLGRKRGGD